VLISLATAGPVTGLFEAVATTIGSGLVVGGFVGGLGGGISGRLSSESERRAVVGSYVGGLMALLALAFDILEKSFV